MITACLLLVCATTVALAAEIQSSDVAGTPDVYCKVVKEPNPSLLGYFGCVHRKLNQKTNEYSMEPIEYWLVKVGDKYAVYFYRVKDGDVYYGWRNDKPTKMTRIE